MIWPDPTHQPTQPPTKPYTHPWVEESHNLQTELKYLDSRGPPMGSGGGWMGVWHGARVHLTHMHMHACIWHHREFPGIPPMGAAIAIEIIMFNMYMCVCVCACMHMHVHVYGAPLTTPHPIHPPSAPRAPGSPKHQNSISLELIEIFWFYLKIFCLWTLLNSYRQ